MLQPRGQIQSRKLRLHGRFFSHMLLLFVSHSQPRGLSPALHGSRWVQPHSAVTLPGGTVPAGLWFISPRSRPCGSLPNSSPVGDAPENPGAPHVGTVPLDGSLHCAGYDAAMAASLVLRVPPVLACPWCPHVAPDVPILPGRAVSPHCRRDAAPAALSRAEQRGLGGAFPKKV